MLDVIRGRHLKNAREFFAQLAEKYPTDRERRRRIFLAMAIDQPTYLDQVVNFALDVWSGASDDR